MTVTTERPNRWLKTNPDCPVRRHAPTMENYRRGCLCPQTIAVMIAWAHESVVDPCPADLHSGTNTAWRNRCRHASAIIAHEEWKSAAKAARRAALAQRRKTGQCGATEHGTARAFQRGCRCPDAILAGQSLNAAGVEKMRAKLDVPERLNPWRQGRMAVDRHNLWMLVHGLVDNPTMGERIAATMILSERGSRVGRYDNRDIADRIGVSCPEVVNRYRKRVVQLRNERHLRRLADVRAKAERVARAIERGRVG